MRMILVTGVNGFVGKHLARELASRGLDIYGIGNHENTPDREIGDILKKYSQCDITDPDAVSKLDLSNVTCVINLAGLANVGASFDNPDLYMKVNVEVLTVLGAELLKQSPTARMIAVSTGALYDPNQEMPLSEESRVVQTGSPYALSKLAMEQAADQLRSQGLDCVVVRPFNHIGPGQGLGFLIPDMVEKLRKTNPDSPKISAGNLKTIRDYTDVRDIVRAYVDLAIAKELNNNLYNVCSGNGHSGEEILQTICRVLDIEFDALQIDVDQSLIRPTDSPKIIGDHSRLTEDTSWDPQINLDKTINDIVYAQ